MDEAVMRGFLNFVEIFFRPTIGQLVIVWLPLILEIIKLIDRVEQFDFAKIFVTRIEIQASKFSSRHSNADMGLVEAIRREIHTKHLTVDYYWIWLEFILFIFSCQVVFKFIWTFCKIKIHCFLLKVWDFFDIEFLQLI